MWPKLTEALLESGLIGRGSLKLQFSYDPVAEYLATWWIHETERSEGRSSEFHALRQRILDSSGLELRRTYMEVAELMR